MVGTAAYQVKTPVVSFRNHSQRLRPSHLNRKKTKAAARSPRIFHILSKPHACWLGICIPLNHLTNKRLLCWVPGVALSTGDAGMPQTGSLPSENFCKMTSKRLGTSKEGVQRLDPALQWIRRKMGWSRWLGATESRQASLWGSSPSVTSTPSSFSTAGYIWGRGSL